MKVIRVKLTKAYIHIGIILTILFVYDFFALSDTKEDYKSIICILLFQFLGILAGYECGQWKTLDTINKAIKYED